MMHHGGKAKGKGKGKQGFQGQCNHYGEWGHKAVVSETPDLLEVWRIGTSVSRMPLRQRQRQRKDRWQGPFGQGFQQGLGKQDEKGYGKGSFSKGKGPCGKGAMYAVLEEQDWSHWNGHTEENCALALFNFTDGPAGMEPTTLPRSSEPMRLDLRDFIKLKKVVTSKLNTKKEKAKMQKRNRFEISGCLCLRTTRSMTRSQRTRAF